jgi:hypothetical protein
MGARVGYKPRSKKKQKEWRDQLRRMIDAGVFGPPTPVRRPEQFLRRYNLLRPNQARPRYGLGTG